jgi:hypothetical protein
MFNQQSMAEPSYPFRKYKRELLFEFESVSEAKVISKIIAYELVDEEEKIYNLSLVDKAEDGSISDMVVSNNNDMEKVLSTVIQTLPIFFEEFEGSKIFFRGSTPARTRLYKIVISKYFQLFEQDYLIYGFLNRESEPFVKEKNYEAFLISKK